MKYWQIAAGSSGYGRDYSDRFLRYGLAFVGGDWQCAAMAQVRAGDVIILKKGTSSILAAGIVVERNGVVQSDAGKDWLLDFDGWELPAWCNVDWHIPDQPVLISGLGQSAIQGVSQEQHIKAARSILDTVEKQSTLEIEPEPVPTIDDEELIGHLIRFGLRPGAAEDLTQALRRIRLLAKFYLQRDNALTKEHETRTFLVVPLLQALGWPEQRMQIEYNVPYVGRVDIACFRKPVVEAVKEEDEDNGISLLIETKGLSYGLDYASEQAKNYVTRFPSCETILVTNGYCYKAYKRDPKKGDFATYPSAYLNLMAPKTAYPLDPVRVRGAIEVLKMLTPR